MAIGTPLRLRGAWADQAERTLRVTDYAARAPDSAEEIERFLAPGFFPGIGRDLARRIVAQLGADALRVIEAEPARGCSRSPASAPAGPPASPPPTPSTATLADTTTLLGAHGATAAFASHGPPWRRGDLAADVAGGGRRCSTWPRSRPPTS
ncbi:MAG: hypothetical protein IPL61_39040 [Myxococcales bacterium]|nr:hypothetical protein [Myxococcales bacterium]